MQRSTKLFLNRFMMMQGTQITLRGDIYSSMPHLALCYMPIKTTTFVISGSQRLD